jgi:large subunit ribosomal protein L17
MITFGKRGDLHARRQALQVMRERKVVAKLFDMVAPRYKDRPGGYTRIVKMGSRLGDNAALSIVELVEEEFTARPPKKAHAPEEAEVKPAVSVPIAEESVPEEAKAQEADVGESVDQEPVAGEKKEEKV